MVWLLVIYYLDKFIGNDFSGRPVNAEEFGVPVDHGLRVRPCGLVLKTI